MIRVIVLLVFLFLIWVLYGSGFEKARKIRIVTILIILCVLGIWLDGYNTRSIKNLVNITDVAICGVSAEHSYRSNFDIAICVQNMAERGTITRLNLQISATSCVADKCETPVSIERSLLTDIAPASRIILDQNLSFETINPEAENIKWSAKVLETKAHR